MKIQKELVAELIYKLTQVSVAGNIFLLDNRSLFSLVYEFRQLYGFEEIELVPNCRIASNSGCSEWH